MCEDVVKGIKREKKDTPQKSCRVSHLQVLEHSYHFGRGETENNTSSLRLPLVINQSSQGKGNLGGVCNQSKAVRYFPTVLPVAFVRERNSPLAHWMKGSFPTSAAHQSFERNPEGC